MGPGLGHRRLVVVLALLALAGCGGGDGGGTDDEASPPAFEGLAPEDPGPVHVHGLGINPADGALFVATHTGLYRVAAEAEKARRVGDGYQDTMGFSVAGPDYFLGSGHPDARDLQTGTPPLLGLIESKDGGKSWRPISLLGKADFHVLRFLGNKVYGYDATNERLLVSRDRGKTWEKRGVPGPLIDLVADPGKPGHLLATSQFGLHSSNDDGSSWDLVTATPGFLAWPSRRTLYLVDGGGAVHMSRNAGGRFAPVGEIGGEPAALVAEGAMELYAALHDGTVMTSADGGSTWTVRSTP
jgi:hypothetical protein